MRFIIFILLAQYVRNRFITHINIHKHQFFHVDETQNIETTTYPARAQIRVAPRVVALSNLIRHKYDNMPE